VLLHILLSLFLIQSGSAEKIVSKLQDKYEDLTYLSAEFIQVESFKLTGSENRTTGKIFVKNGVKYRLETEDQVIVTDGKSVWTYSRLNNQVLIDRVKEGDGSLLPRDLLFRYPRDYFATLLQEEKIGEKEYYVLKLDPREGVHGYVKTMKVWVSQDSYLISKIEYTDFNDNISSFEVRKVDIETEIPESTFTFKIDDTMDVVDLRM
jgi:chaperone LolA